MWCAADRSHQHRTRCIRCMQHVISPGAWGPVQLYYLVMLQVQRLCIQCGTHVWRLHTSVPARLGWRLPHGPWGVWPPISHIGQAWTFHIGKVTAPDRAVRFLNRTGGLPHWSGAFPYAQHALAMHSAIANNVLLCSIFGHGLNIRDRLGHRVSELVSPSSCVRRGLWLSAIGSDSIVQFLTETGGLSGIAPGERGAELAVCDRLSRRW